MKIWTSRTGAIFNLTFYSYAKPDHSHLTEQSGPLVEPVLLAQRFEWYCRIVRRESTGLGPGVIPPISPGLWSIRRKLTSVWKRWRTLSPEVFQPQITFFALFEAELGINPKPQHDPTCFFWVDYGHYGKTIIVFEAVNIRGTDKSVYSVGCLRHEDHLWSLRKLSIKDGANCSQRWLPSWIENSAVLRTNIIYVEALLPWRCLSMNKHWTAIIVGRKVSYLLLSIIYGSILLISAHGNE